MQPLLIIHGTFIFTIFVYLGIGYFMGGYVRGIPPETLLLLKVMLGAVFASVIAFAPVMFRRMLSSAPGREDASLRQRWFTAHIIRLAFYESGALYGLLLRLLGASMLDQLIFSLPALFLMIVSTPTDEKFEEMKRTL